MSNDLVYKVALIASLVLGMGSIDMILEGVRGIQNSPKDNSLEKRSIDYDALNYNTREVRAGGYFVIASIVGGIGSVRLMNRKKSQNFHYN